MYLPSDMVIIIFFVKSNIIFFYFTLQILQSPEGSCRKNIINNKLRLHCLERLSKLIDAHQTIGTR